MKSIKLILWWIGFLLVAGFFLSGWLHLGSSVIHEVQRPSTFNPFTK